MKRFLGVCVAFLVLVLVLPGFTQDAVVLSRAVAFGKSVPPHATLARLTKLLPKGTKLGAQGVVTVGPGKTWIVVPFRGTLNGQFVFFHTRQTLPRKKGAPPPPPFAGANQLLATDGVHYVEVFLGGVLKSGKKGALTAETKRYVDALAKKLGKPTQRKNTGEEGGPDAIGWTADWKLGGAREIGFMHSFALLSSQERPILSVSWPYSKIYQQ